MIKLIKKLVYKYFTRQIGMKEFDINEHVQLPAEIKLAKPGVSPDMRFNLLLGVDITSNRDGTFDVSINNMIFSSNGDKARKYIEEVGADTVKNTAALCALVGSKYIAATDASAYSPATVAPAGVDPLAPPPIDPKLLN